MQAIEQVSHGSDPSGRYGRTYELHAFTRKREMKPFDDAAYTMAAVSAVVALYRVLVKNGVLTRDEAVRTLLDEAVSRAIQAEAQQQGEAAA
ncbi:MAG: hypothetical protein ABWZ93_17000, partial [Xanthobacteraceae bacterium]